MKRIVSLVPVSVAVVAGLVLAGYSSSGETAEDRFFGVKDPNAIVAIKLSNTAGGMELEHVQFGVAGAPAAVLVS